MSSGGGGAASVLGKKKRRGKKKHQQQQQQQRQQEMYEMPPPQQEEDEEEEDNGEDYGDDEDDDTVSQAAAAAEAVTAAMAGAKSTAVAKKANDAMSGAAGLVLGLFSGLVDFHEQQAKEHKAVARLLSSGVRSLQKSITKQGGSMFAGSAMEGTDGKRKKRKRKDPAMPKRPGNAYVRFLSIKMKELKEQQPGEQQKVLMTQAARFWHQLSDEQKASYQAPQEEEERYQRNIAKYKQAREAAIESGASPAEADAAAAAAVGTVPPTGKANKKGPAAKSPARRNDQVQFRAHAATAPTSDSDDDDDASDSNDDDDDDDDDEEDEEEDDDDQEEEVAPPVKKARPPPVEDSSSDEDTSSGEDSDDEEEDEDGDAVNFGGKPLASAPVRAGQAKANRHAAAIPAASGKKKKAHQVQRVAPAQGPSPAAKAGKSKKGKKRHSHKGAQQR